MICRPVLSVPVMAVADARGHFSSIVLLLTSLDCRPSLRCRLASFVPMSLLVDRSAH